MSQGQPARCTHIIARLRGDSMRRTDAGSILLLTGSMSAKTGVAPPATMQAALAKKLREGRITSSTAPIPTARSASDSDTVERKRVREGQGGSVSVEIGGIRTIKK